MDKPSSPSRRPSPSTARAGLLSVALAASLVASSAPRIERAPRIEAPKLAPSPSRRRRKASKGKTLRRWKRDAPPVVTFGVAARDTLIQQWTKIGPKRKRRLMRAVARLEAFHKRHEGPRGSAEILQDFRREASKVRL